MSEDLSAFAKKRKTKKIRRYVFLGILLAVLLGGALYLSLENYFIAKDVLVQKSTIYNTEDILSVVSIKKNTPLYKIDRKKLAKKVEANFPYLVNVKISGKLPDKVKVTFNEKFGEFGIKMGVELFAVDKELMVLAKESTDTGIPRINLIAGDVDRCIVGEKLTFMDEDTHQIILSLVESLDKENIIEKISEIDVSDNFNISIRYENRFQVLLGDREEFDEKLAMIREVIKDLEEGTTGQIDIADPDNAYVKLENQIS
ncbi:MAG: FtsQ-type POTRA domain-containing protein [Clostridia bacterium]|nr:FtsQ-type POTRA domain-containing protein [Clostridia bacterium]